MHGIAIVSIQRQKSSTLQTFYTRLLYAVSAERDITFMNDFQPNVEVVRFILRVVCVSVCVRLCMTLLYCG